MRFIGTHVWCAKEDDTVSRNVDVVEGREIRRVARFGVGQGLFAVDSVG